jgi:hypothetical protein
MINIKPKRIKKSLAFDLYPLLRTSEWLEAEPEVTVYKEIRAQELTESLWSNTQSPWYHRINMLGDSGQQKMISQAGWIRSLMATFIKNLKNKRDEIGGLYGTNIEKHDVLPWDRAQQAAFIIFVGQKMRDKIFNSQYQWAKILRSLEPEKTTLEMDPAFTNPLSGLNTDIGNRAFLSIVNDLCFVKINDLDLSSWGFEEQSDATDEQTVLDYINDLKQNQKISMFIEDLTTYLASYDWRTAAAPELSPELLIIKRSFRGGPGYKSMRIDLLSHLMKQKGPVYEAAKEVYLKTEAI